MTGDTGEEAKRSPLIGMAAVLSAAFSSAFASVRAPHTNLQRVLPPKWVFNVTLVLALASSPDRAGRELQSTDVRDCASMLAVSAATVRVGRCTLSAS